ncbi:DNA-protecting protein DprA [Limosilactobacillus sp. RRLNB_1_1]|uniref:DNA-protecting protein DprA n=1 Tax=Limosilactobacillus albertensis TaxID=2759752 RepID=A0A7W3TTT7_9LACO|nr:DNA-processing protein DprA [Limosilactobacillus albertensis]MBB1070608.1 DNA-protecting protein DprA [Limosilactobacillus albertensis]MCD7117355.1 DNA-processing protein DprA [Limosilactobacillus albertensis]MCD7129122.1 DNA-processing protein DprA [Limosilactobacillus albertensis]
MLQVRDFLLRLSLCRGVGLVSKYRLWECARQTRCFNNIDYLIDHANVSLRSATALKNNWGSTELDDAVAANGQIAFITIADPLYPLGLKETYCPPLVLFYRGNLGLLHQPSIGVVGTRQITNYGQSALRGLLPPLIKRQIVIVSGLAQGVDGFSHELALKYRGQTIGVIGCGIDQVYPKSHYSLQEEVAKCGLLLSEYGLGEPPLPYHFPERNRIIAGLSEVVLVVEAKKRSGSLITANIGLDENRTVCAVPGRIDAPLSVGCNSLIAAGAKPILSAQDLLDEFQLYN